ncbi:MAG: hypothetical protein ACK5LO_00110 [Leucobacter sp.]
MRKKKLTLGLATAAALIVPLGFASPAIAESVEETPAVEVADEIPANAVNGAEVPATALPTDESVSEQQQFEAPVEEAPAEGAEEAPEGEAGEPSTDATAGATAASSTTFAAPTFSLPSKLSPSKKGAVEKGFTVRFTGPAANNNLYYSPYGNDYLGPKVTTVKTSKGVKSSYVLKPSVWAPTSNVFPNKDNAYTVRLSTYVTPGRYKTTVPIRQSKWNGSSYTRTVKSTTKEFVVRSNPSLSKAQTSWSGYSTSKGTFKMSLRAPDYQYGAKVTAYYKAPGKKSYKAVATTKLKKGSANSKVNFNISKTKKVKIGGRLYVKIGGVTYADGYKTASAKVKRR